VRKRKREERKMMEREKGFIVSPMLRCMFHLLWARDPKNKNVKIHVVFLKTFKINVISLQFMMDMEVQEDKPVKQQMTIFNHSFKKVLLKES
jgi:hypothetical protein